MSECGKLQLTIESLCDAGHGELSTLNTSVRARAKCCCPVPFFLPSDTPARAIDAIPVFRRTMFTPLVQGKESRIVDGARCDCCSIGQLITQANRVTELASLCAGTRRPQRTTLSCQGGFAPMQERQRGQGLAVRTEMSMQGPAAPDGSSLGQASHRPLRRTGPCFPATTPQEQAQEQQQEDEGRQQSVHRQSTKEDS